mmetsp:Transcript_27136/g.63551  ORF Transcript_27136/g.63551 Transcript_27136/m.63551 type:complete len:713 (-) Transcript_27136:90-2228(-)
MAHYHRQPPFASAAAYPTSQVLMQSGSIVAQGQDESALLETWVELPTMHYDVTNKDSACIMCCLCPCMGWNSLRMVMDDQEVTLKAKNFCCTSVQKRPYAQLGEVTVIRKLGGACGAVLLSDLTPVTEDGQGGMAPGWSCCNTRLVEELAEELQRRKEVRGSIAQIQKLDHMYNHVLQLRGRLMPLLAQRGAKYQEWVPILPDDPVQRPDQVYNMSNFLECCTIRKLILRPEEAEVRVEDICSCNQIVQKREYAQLGNVNRLKSCICCVGVSSDLGHFNPGYGCNRSKVNEVVEEMQDRMIRRGNMGQIRKQELLLQQMGELLRQVNALQGATAAYYPPSPAMMKRAFPGEKVPREGSGAWKITSVEEKSYNITDYCQNCAKCCCTLGCAGWGTDMLDLEKDSLYLVEKDNFDNSRIKMPYAQLESVDYTRESCCFYRVNFASPGWGCNRKLVEELAEELQHRKIERGNVAQIRQLEALDKSSREIQFKLASTIERLGSNYPPTPKDMSTMYRGVMAPKALTMDRPHNEPSQTFETKEFDVTNYCTSFFSFVCSLGCAGPCTKEKIELQPEEMVKTTQNWCLTRKERTPYAQLGSVDVESACGCCRSIPDVGSAGCGCSVRLMEELADELQERKVKRGNIAQIKLKENIMYSVLKSKTMVDVLENSAGKMPGPVTRKVVKKVTKKKVGTKKSTAKASTKQGKKKSTKQAPRG